jgi:hypothetical protein|nr:MAG TPA: hypothetical protein [Caudoviricetes sp.]
MMLTKEKCENALNNILCNIGVARSDYRTSGKAKEDYCTLNSLIEEHFDNPPLKFDELEENMWVWDNKRKVKLLIAYCYSEDDMGYYNLSNPEDYKYVHIEFEENRFYRKQVEE